MECSRPATPRAISMEDSVPVATSYKRRTYVNQAEELRRCLFRSIAAIIEDNAALLWVIYGGLIGAPPVIVANALVMPPRLGQPYERQRPEPIRLLVVAWIKSLRRIFSLARFSCGFHVDTRTVIYVDCGIAISTCFWRRERDSNPRRAFDPYTLSRGAPSTTRPSLRCEGKCFSLRRGCRAVGGHHTQSRARAAKSRSAQGVYVVSRARTNSCTDSSAASSASGLLPPACAKSARPPPRPPTSAATAPASSPAWMREV